MTNFCNFIDFKTGDVNWEWLANILGEKITNNDEQQTRVRKLRIAKDYAMYVARQDLEHLFGKIGSKIFQIQRMDNIIKTLKLWEV